jgi:DNA-binding CsgD family transcriptional regulator
MDEMFVLRQDRRRVDRNKRKTFDPTRLNQRHHEILNLHVTGMKEGQIAQTLGCHVATVRNAIESTLGKEKIALLRGTRDAETMDARDYINSLVPAALKVYEKILSEEKAHGGADLRLQKSTADSLLKDMAGLAAPKKVLVGTAKMTPELLDEIKENGKKAAKECGAVIDTTPEYEGEDNGPERAGTE